MNASKLANAISKVLETAYNYSNIPQTVADSLLSDAKATLFGTAIVKQGKDYCVAYAAVLSQTVAALPNGEQAAFILAKRLNNLRVAVTRENTDFSFSVSGLTLTVVARKPKAEKTTKPDESAPTAAESTQADEQADKTVQTAVKLDSPEVAGLKVEIEQLRQSLRSANASLDDAIKARDEARGERDEARKARDEAIAELAKLHASRKPQPRKPQAAAAQAAA